MAFKMPSRVKETTVTSGTGTYALAGPVLAFRAFSAGLLNGDTTHYYVEGGSDYEYGSGTYSANTLARTTIFKSSNSNVAVNWPAGTKTIGISEIGPSDLDATNIGLMNSLMEMPTGWRNRIINGDFAIDQRTNGSGVITTNAVVTYNMDRWYGYSSPVGTVGMQRLAYSASEFQGYFGTGTLDASLAAGDIYMFGQHIEGFNCRDFLWGQADAKPITISFWALYSAGAGTFPLAIRNGAGNRSWLGSFAASTTWTKIVMTVPGDTTGTWVKDNGIGLRINIALGAGTTYQGAAGWQAGDFISLAGMTNAMAVAGGISLRDFQVEVGSVATEYERVQYGDQLARCQRYYEKSVTNVSGGRFSGNVTSTQGYYSTTHFIVSKRATPTIVLTDGGSALCFPATPATPGVDAGGFYEGRNANATGTGLFASNWTASAEL